MLQRIQNAKSAVMGTTTVPRGELRITAPTMYGRMAVLPVMADLLREHDELRAQLLLVDRNVRLVEEGIDAAVRIGVLDDSSMLTATVGSVHQCLVASPSYCARRGTPCKPDDLLGHDIVGDDSARIGRRWKFDNYERRSVVVSPRFNVNTTEARLAAAEAGLGIANILDYQAASGLAAGTLYAILQDYAPPPIPVQLGSGPFTG